VNPDFYVALQVTVVGMVLVFGTLIICAGVISLLSRMFPGAPEAKEEDAAEAEVFPEVADEVAPVANVAAAEAAAIAVALALASRATAAMPARTVVLPYWAANRAGAAEMNEDIVGEVVMIIDTNPGPGTWSGAGRVQTAR
jgi:Na+-transporting methylmalonyl-CoA/oxaloacetate decarboxylase gamma subunit